MDGSESYKRLKTSSGDAVSTTSGATHLPMYQPPPHLGPRRSPAASASIARPTNGRGTLKLTVKAAPSKLRQITQALPPNPHTGSPSESDATPVPAARAARATRNPRTVVEPDSDDMDEDEEVEAVEEDDVDQEILANEDSEDDAEGEDEEMEDHPPPPIIRQERVSGKAKPNVTVTAPPEGPLKSVEDKEMEDEDEELSELDSDEGGEDAGDDDEEDVSDEDDENSRSATPDLSKLTARQRGQYQEIDDGHLQALSNEAQKKKHLTAEEHAMRRAEMARRRKNLSEKRNEEEKQDTINKLLKKPAPKRRTRQEILAAQQADMTPGLEDGEEEKPDGLYVRWVNTQHGSRIGVPTEWLEAPIGDVYGRRVTSGRLVEEVN